MSSALPTSSESSSWTNFTETLDIGHTGRLILALVVGGVFFVRFLTNNKAANYPLINPTSGFELTGKARRAQFKKDAQNVLAEGSAKYNGEPFNMLTESGVVTALSSEYIDLIRDEKGLSFMSTVEEDFHSRIPGFEAWSSGTRSDALVQSVMRKQLTKSLNKVTLPLSQEASFAVDLNFGHNQEWHQITLFDPIQDVIARISARVFLGSAVCRNEDWLDITKTFTVKGYEAADGLRQYSYWMRRFVHRFDAKVNHVRQLTQRAIEIISPVLAERKKERRDAEASGLPAPKFDDALDWFEEESKGRDYDMAVIQLTLAMAALHTTSDLTMKTMLHLAQQPELVAELREEISSTLREHGWKKTSLYNMKLLDSVIKETQRLEPIRLTTMERKASTNIKLSNGVVIPKGARLTCSTDRRLSPEIYPDPFKFDGHRFQEWRGTDKDSRAHLVSTGPASPGFGHGMHGCPGRFFAANEIKVAICHLIMKYDVQLPPGTLSTAPLIYGFNVIASPGAKVMVKKRAEVEVDIDSIA